MCEGIALLHTNNNPLRYKWKGPRLQCNLFTSHRIVSNASNVGCRIQVQSFEIVNSRNLRLVRRQKIEEVHC